MVSGEAEKGHKAWPLIKNQEENIYVEYAQPFNAFNLKQNKTEEQTSFREGISRTATDQEKVIQGDGYTLLTITAGLHDHELRCCCLPSFLDLEGIAPTSAEG